MASSLNRSFYCIKGLLQAEQRLVSSVVISRRNYAPELRILPKSRLHPHASTLYGGRNTVTLIPGDGIGPELVQYVKEVFRCAGAPVDFEEAQVQTEDPLDRSLDQAILAIQRNGVALKGSSKLSTSFGLGNKLDATSGVASQQSTGKSGVVTPEHLSLFDGSIQSKKNDPAYRSRNVTLRTRLDMYVNLLRCKTIPGIRVRHPTIDILIIRENTEGEYSGVEHESVPGVVESLKLITRARSKRIAEYAFKYATEHGRKKVTAIHKANIMKAADGLFIECCNEVAANYPNLKYDTMIVDNACMQLVSRPTQFDVMVMPNLYGNIIANIGCGLVGGAGIVAGRNVGDKYAIFEAGARSAARELVGKNVANPTALLMASADLLKHLGHETHCSLIKNALLRTIANENVKTRDLGGTATTSEFVATVIKDIMKHK